MMRKIVLLIIFIAAFVSGIVLSSVMHLGCPMVSINLINESGKDIPIVDIFHETKYGETHLHVTNLKTGEKRKMKVWTPSEGSYRLIVTFADKRQLASGAGYIEPGYKMTESIKYDKIESCGP